MELVMIIWLVSAMVGTVIGLSHGKPAKGAFLGLIFGPVGWVLAALDVGFMGIGLVVVLFILGGLALLRLAHMDADVTRRDSEQSPQVTAAAPPADREASQIAADKKDESFDADGMTTPPPPGTKTEKFWGEIVQHMEGGRLLMQTNHGRVVVQMPKELEVPDGSFVPKFDGVVTGTYRYVTTDGTTRDVWHVLYIPPALMPGRSLASALAPIDPNLPQEEKLRLIRERGLILREQQREADEKGRSWMWDPNRKTGLDQRNRGSSERVKTEQEAMAEWAIRARGGRVTPPGE